ncbi:hypothetical protein T10_2748 [Trichinella papuae]|uniref:Uncharacterized protein n=1 Tax=Trichinella papuae TaxID=268474 RepID=A0A0V1MHP6_9BILA|nr:hypothetical protein T10_2748 [Trichinella papuae]
MKDEVCDIRFLHELNFTNFNYVIISIFCFPCNVRKSKFLMFNYSKYNFEKTEKILNLSTVLVNLIHVIGFWLLQCTVVLCIFVHAYLLQLIALIIPVYGVDLCNSMKLMNAMFSFFFGVVLNSTLKDINVLVVLLVNVKSVTYRISDLFGQIYEFT